MVTEDKLKIDTWHQPLSSSCTCSHVYTCIAPTLCMQMLTHALPPHYIHMLIHIHVLSPYLYMLYPSTLYMHILTHIDVLAPHVHMLTHIHALPTHTHSTWTCSHMYTCAYITPTHTHKVRNKIKVTSSFVFRAVLTSFLLTWHKQESSEKRDQLRKCPHQTSNL